MSRSTTPDPDEFDWPSDINDYDWGSDGPHPEAAVTKAGTVHATLKPSFGTPARLRQSPRSRWCFGGTIQLPQHSVCYHSWLGAEVVAEATAKTPTTPRADDATKELGLQTIPRAHVNVAQ